jgi:hypothetical protein
MMLCVWLGYIVFVLEHVAGYTLEETLSFTSREQLVGGKGFIAWVEINQGVSNVVGGLTAPGSAPPAALSHYADDDGSIVMGLRMVFPQNNGMRSGLLIWTAGPTDSASEYT